MIGITNKQKEQLVKAAIAGGLLSGVTSIVYGAAPVPIAGYNIPAMIPVFLAGSAASLTTDLISSQLNLPTTSAQKIADLSALAVSSGISAAAVVLLLKASVGLPNNVILPVVAIAAGSQAGSDYITHKFLESSDGMLIF